MSHIYRPSLKTSTAMWLHISFHFWQAIHGSRGGFCQRRLPSFPLHQIPSHHSEREIPRESLRAGSRVEIKKEWQVKRWTEGKVEQCWCQAWDIWMKKSSRPRWGRVPPPSGSRIVTAGPSWRGLVLLHEHFGLIRSRFHSNTFDAWTVRRNVFVWHLTWKESPVSASAL